MTASESRHQRAATADSQQNLLRPPGEIRNYIYHLLIYASLSPEFQASLKPKDPIPIPISHAVLSLQPITRAWDAEFLSRPFAHGASLRINAIPAACQRLELAWLTSQTRMQLRGTTDILGSFGRPTSASTPPPPPPGLADLRRRYHLRLLLRQGNWLGFEGRRFLAPGAARDFVLNTEDYPGYAVGRYLREEAPDAAMTVRIVTLSNPADEEE
ncbi:hypothetical protein V2W45_1466518 [Cenococcum geophilum]